MVESMEGFPESIRFLNKDREWAKQVPLVSDVLYSPPQYRVALENYLEQYLNFYLAPTLAVAMAAVERLSKAQRGRANFFVLAAFDNQVVKTDAAAQLSGFKPALSVVQCDKQYLPVFEQLLQGVMMGSEAAVTAATILPEGIILLADNGAAIRGERVYAGGSIGLFEGKRIGRKKNLELLETEIATLEQTTKALQHDLAAVQDTIAHLKRQDQAPLIRREREELNLLQQQVVALSAKYENTAQYINDIALRKTQAEQTMTGIAATDGDLTTQLHDLQAKQAAVLAQIAAVDTNFNKMAQELGTASTDFNAKNITFIRQQNKVQTLQRELSFKQKQCTDLTEQTANNAQERQANTDKLAAAQTQSDELTQTIQAKYQERNAFEQTLTGAEQAFYQSRTNINNMEEKTRLASKKRQEQQQNIATLKDKFGEVKLALSSIGERLRIEFSIELNDIINNEPNLTLDKKWFGNARRGLKKRLDNYGEVNPMAIEAYGEMAERQTFIVTQRDDLVNAKTSLLDTISEIENTATQQFMTCFEQTRQNFMQVFRSLFTADDQCDLILSDPANPLDSKIDIIAKPKGKRPQTINQLSGGEKTLTATALLFSLYLLKPAPFCIFDEVDAPLDDANIDKFNNIIKEFSKNSQFIIVTHNKQTMSSVDVIYGVSMVEQGVSRVLPVDFRSLA